MPERLPFVDDLATFGYRSAIIDDGGEVGYAELATQVQHRRCRLGPPRRLVAIAATNDRDTVTTYLAALAGGHAVLLCDAAALEPLVAVYDPDVVHVGGQVTQRRPGTTHELHPDLALLLSTSGSTGSPKLVRLSRACLAANAAAIAESLDIRDSDRAALNLPLHYCYGLSVLHSNLLRGASVLLSGESVTEPRFWAGFQVHGATSLHGVPYTFELLDEVGFAAMELPTLRYVTQAGGRLEPQTVHRYAELGRRRGFAFVVMYGQTEATARMAYLPAEHAAAAPSAIGRPIPGGRFSIEGAEDGVGELVYHGPNVMLGYARSPADLARGRTVEALHTGDLARRRPDGLYELVGRRSRFVKPFGLRVDLDGVERLLAETGRQAAATGTDDGIAVAVVGTDPAATAQLLSDRLGLPPAAVRVVGLEALPRRPNGKLDHAAVGALTAAEPACERRPPNVRAAFATVFPDDELTDATTFVGLGGDSLSYVRMATALQRVLGWVPPDWPTTPLGELTRLVPRRGGWPLVETAVVLRAVAIVLVVGTHVGLFMLAGGAHLLLGVAGWTFARFVLQTREPGSPSRAALRNLVRLAVPSALWIAWRAHDQDDVFAVNALLLNYFLDPPRFAYWFVEGLAQILLLFAAVLAVPAVRRAERAQPFGFALAVLVLALVGRLFPEPGNVFSAHLMSPHLILWVFVLGWVVQRADTPARRALTAVLVVGLVPSFFTAIPQQAVIVTVGLLALLGLRGVRLPGWAVLPAASVAAASLAIYLTHFAVFPYLLAHLHPVVVLAVCLAVGVAVQVLLGAVCRRLRPRWRSWWRRAWPLPAAVSAPAARAPRRGRT